MREKKNNYHVLSWYKYILEIVRGSTTSTWHSSILETGREKRMQRARPDLLDVAEGGLLVQVF